MLASQALWGRLLIKSPISNKYHLEQEPPEATGLPNPVKGPEVQKTRGTMKG